VGLLVTDATRAQAADAFRYTSLGTVQVKGKSAPVELFVPHRQGPAVK
jgi:class 3 adenylate cyclase